MALWSKRKSNDSTPAVKRPGSKEYNKLPPATRALTVYAEDGGSWPHLGPIVERLTEVHGHTVCYLTSSDADPVFDRGLTKVLPFAIGEGVGRSFLFQTMETGVLVATVPQLGIKVLPRSKRAKELGTKYVYVFHSMASTHMIYEPDGFDHYDHVLCVGPYMQREIRAREAQLGTPPKELIAHGYGRLDAIVAAAGSAPSNDPPIVLVAPSWGPHCIFETCGIELVQILLDAGFHVIARPHPMTAKRTPEALTKLAATFAGREHFELEQNVASQESLHRSDIMVSDWSGAALEYAFGLERPVLFIDVPRKVNNPNYQQLAIEPFEAVIRDQIGAVIDPKNLGAAPDAARRLLQDPDAFTAQIRAVRDANVFNIGTSADVAAQHISSLVTTYLTRIAR